LDALLAARWLLDQPWTEPADVLAAPVARRDFVRLVAAVMSRHQRHAVDHQGRCRIGTRRRRVRRIRTRPGTVYSALHCYLS
jgi:hypothetical protein